MISIMLLDNLSRPFLHRVINSINTLTLKTILISIMYYDLLLVSYISGLGRDMKHPLYYSNLLYCLVETLRNTLLLCCLLHRKLIGMVVLFIIIFFLVSIVEPFAQMVYCCTFIIFTLFKKCGKKN